MLSELENYILQDVTLPDLKHKSVVNAVFFGNV